MIDKDKGLALLGSGLKPVDVATSLGCDPSYVNQWLMDDEFRQKVLALRIQSLQAHTKRDLKIDEIEDELIQKLSDNIKYMTKMSDIVRAFSIVNSAKRRGATVAGDISLTQNVVTINLPPAARALFLPKMNAQGEVVQVGDTVTVTKPLQTLMAERLKLQQRAQDAQDAAVVGTNENRPGSESQRSPAEAGL